VPRKPFALLGGTIQRRGSCARKTLLVRIGIAVIEHGIRCAIRIAESLRASGRGWPENATYNGGILRRGHGAMGEHAQARHCSHRCRGMNCRGPQPRLGSSGIVRARIGTRPKKGRPAITSQPPAANDLCAMRHLTAVGFLQSAFMADVSCSELPAIDSISTSVLEAQACRPRDHQPTRNHQHSAHYAPHCVGGSRGRLDDAQGIAIRITPAAIMITPSQL
jgi:hypothetical protein